MAACTAASRHRSNTHAGRQVWPAHATGGSDSAIAVDQYVSPGRAHVHELRVGVRVSRGGTRGVRMQDAAGGIFLRAWGSPRTVSVRGTSSRTMLARCWGASVRMQKPPC